MLLGCRLNTTPCALCCELQYCYTSDKPGNMYHAQPLRTSRTAAPIVRAEWCCLYLCGTLYQQKIQIDRSILLPAFSSNFSSPVPRRIVAMHFIWTAAAAAGGGGVQSSRYQKHIRSCRTVGSRRGHTCCARSARCLLSRVAAFACRLPWISSFFSEQRETQPHIIHTWKTTARRTMTTVCASPHRVPANGCPNVCR